MNAAANRRPQRLIVVCQLFHPELISTGQTLTELMEELAGRGINIAVIAAQPTVIPGAPRVPTRLEHAGLVIVRTWSTRFRKTSYLGKLCNLTTFFVTAWWEILWHHRDAQILLLTNPPYLPLMGWFFSRWRRQRFGVLLFDIMPEQAELLHFIRPGGNIARAWRALNGVWYRAADYVVVLSRDMLEGALANANLRGTRFEKTARAKTSIVHVWSDDRMISPRSKSESSEAARLAVLHRLVVQYSGNHGRFHDIETLVGIARTFAGDPRVTFQFIGEGQKKVIACQLTAEDTSGSFYESTYVPKEMLPDSLAMADIGVVAQMPGQERVCYPSKLLGVMAAGRAVLAICPPNCELAELVKSHEIGWVVPNGDIESGRRAVAQALADQQRVKLMGERANRILREHFTLSAAAERYAQLIADQPRQ